MEAENGVKKVEAVMLVCGGGLRTVPDDIAQVLSNFMKQEQQNNGAN